MVTEDYVSLKTAKLLKEKGFNEKAKSYFTDDGLVGYMFGTGQKSNSELEECFYSRPTLQMVMKWLRETFEIHCQIDCPIAASNWVYGIRDLNKDEWLTDYRNMGDNDTYEEACEAAIKYCLENLI